MKTGVDGKALKRARDQELLHKLRTGWNVVRNRYGYNDADAGRGLILLSAFLAPFVLIYVLPWYIFVVLLKIEFVALILPFLLICGIIGGIFFFLLMANYAWVSGWYQ